MRNKNHISEKDLRAALRNCDVIPSLEDWISRRKSWHESDFAEWDSLMDDARSIVIRLAKSCGFEI